MNVVLNISEFKEYSDAELAEKLGISNDESFDFSSLFVDDEETESFTPEKEVKKESDFVKLTKRMIQETEEQILYLENKVNQFTKKTVFVGDEMGGRYKSVYKINERKRTGLLKLLYADLKRYKSEIESF